MPKKIIKDSQIEGLYLRWLRGASLAELGESLAVHKTTVRSAFISKYGDGCCQRKKSNTIAQVVQEDYLRKGRYSAKQKAEISKWLDTLSTDDLLDSVAFYTEKEMDNYTTTYCGVSRDFREIATLLEVKGTVVG